MIALFGNISLYFALFFALAQSLLPLWGHYRHNNYALAIARPAAYGQLFFVCSAYLLLTFAFVQNDFSLAYVAENSHPLLPLMYRLTAVWGAHEGSILLWILILNSWTIAFLLFYPRFFAKTNHHDYHFLSLVLAVLGLMSCCFLFFLLLTSNPFLTTSIIQQGDDLNPLLQDPGFVIHPPILYIGYVGFSVAFAITQAALITNNFSVNWTIITRKFAIAAWCFLTFGITLGSWWAYRVLGWGGFWFWDPVENASLLPWLSGTALIHVLILTEKRDVAKSWAALLAIITFALSVLGTFLVRSGVLISAHTFANDPARGVFLLILLAILTTAALTLYVRRLPQLQNHARQIFSWRSREMMLFINSALLFIAMFTILLGTLYPLIIDALHLGAISVGAPYFNQVMIPFVFIIMACMGLAPFCPWQLLPSKKFWTSCAKNLSLSIVSACALIYFFTQTFYLLPAISLSLSLWILLSLRGHYRSNFSMSLAHLGFAILVIGIMFSSLLTKERDVRIKPNDVVAIGPYQFSFINIEGVSGANYRGIRANFAVMKGYHHVTDLYPEKRIYTVRDMVMTKVDISPGIFRDLYIALGEPLDSDYWSVRIYYKPFVRWIWFGGILMMLGGFINFRRKI